MNERKCRLLDPINSIERSQWLLLVTRAHNISFVAGVYRLGLDRAAQKKKKLIRRCVHKVIFFFFLINTTVIPPVSHVFFCPRRFE